MVSCTSRLRALDRTAIPVDNEYFEWLDVVDAVERYLGSGAARPFVFVELGAGYGRWSERAITCLLQRIPLADYRIVAVEADPGHYRSLAAYLTKHGISLERCTLINAPIWRDRRIVKFQSGDTDNWYGQAVITDGYYFHLRTTPWEWWDRFFGRKRKVLKLRAVTLSDVLSGVETVDLMDMDIQGAEAEVIESSLDVLQSKVMAVHIGTHSREVENRICAAMHAWRKRWEFACLGQRETPQGPIQFEDGVMSFLNTRKLL